MRPHLQRDSAGWYFGERPAWETYPANLCPLRSQAAKIGFGSAASKARANEKNDDSPDPRCGSETRRVDRASAIGRFLSTGLLIPSLNEAVRAGPEGAP